MLVYPAHTIGDFFGRSDLDSLTLLDDLYIVRSIHHTLVSTSIEPSISTIHELNLEFSSFEIYRVH